MRIAKSILCKVKYPLCWLSLWGRLCERTFNTEHLRVTQFSWITVTKENKTVCTQISRHGERSSWASPSGGGGTGGSPGGSSPSELGTGSNVACKTASIAAWSPKRKPAWKTAASNDAFCQMLSNAHICIYVYILLSNIYVYIYISSILSHVDLLVGHVFKRAPKMNTFRQIGAEMPLLACLFTKGILCM